MTTSPEPRVKVTIERPALLEYDVPADQVEHLLRSPLVLHKPIRILPSGSVTDEAKLVGFGEITDYWPKNKERVA